MIIETDRLRIVSLTIQQFELLLSGIEKIEKELNLNPSNQHLSNHLQAAMELQYQEALKYPDYYIWLASRQIILKSENRIIGSTNFKNSPDEDKYPEIGYGINSDYQNQGYMTEAVHALCKWAMQQPPVKGVSAETEKGNYASCRVLQKCGFVKYAESDSSFWWKLEN